MIRTVPLDQAVGLILAHDITEIRPGEFKGPAFRRGHQIRCRDVEHLRRLGKEHLFVLTPEPGELHEDEAAVQLAEALCGEGVGWDEPPREGKVNLKARWPGLLKVEVEALARFNSVGEVMCATCHTNSLVQPGQLVAATRAIPLLIRQERVEQAVTIAGEFQGVVRVLPLKPARVGVLITGNEVYHGLIEDRFAPIIREKVQALGGDVLQVRFAPDDQGCIAREVLALQERGADLIITTGGMSVDPDDCTRAGLAQAGARDLLYGSAVLPGAMFMLAYLGEVPVLGVPACGLHHAATIFDLVYPRILAGERLTRKDLSRMGHGGLCLECPTCRFPRCPFGKGA
jgi:molybdenum cofactor synthesis domain-containing protein